MKITFLLISMIIAVFVAEIFAGPSAIEEYGFSGKNFLEKPHVIITSIFLHGGLDHLLSNILVLIFFGLAVESELGWKKMLFIFFLGAFAGDALSLLFYPFDAVSIGASAGIFALMGAGMIVRPFDLSLSGYNAMPLALLGMSYIIYNIYGFFSGPSNISYIAHFGGLFVGLGFGFRAKGMKKGILIIAVSASVLIAIMAAWRVLL